MAALDQSKPDQLVRRWPSLRSLVLVAAVQFRVERAMLVRAVVPGEGEPVRPLRPADSTGRSLWKSPPRSARIQNFVDQRSEVSTWKGFCSAGRSRNSSGKHSEP
jgi:hypothetical protein